jgi:hypothetical protein
MPASQGRGCCGISGSTTSASAPSSKAVVQLLLAQHLGSEAVQPGARGQQAGQHDGRPASRGGAVTHSAPIR